MLKQIKTFIYGTLPYIGMSLFNQKSPELKYRKYMRDHGYTRYPYPFAEKYMQIDTDVYRDEVKGLPYVIHRSGRKLYFPRNADNSSIKKAYRALLIEQDLAHPHHYVDSLDEFRDKILLDVGSAEGFTSLDAIEVVKKVYLFECEPAWIEALQATFEPWKEKVEIIKKYVGNTCDDIHVTLDDFFKDKVKDNLFLKMDIEGAECDALSGAEQLFREAKNLDFAICTYHRPDDAKQIQAYLDRHNCEWKFPEQLFYLKHCFRICLVRGHN